MTTPKVSIIIPVYNVESYLAKCLESVCGQTLDEIEIIIVNDQSPDNSEKIIKEFQARDTRIKYIKHESNLGLGGVRNTGIEAATGEYQWHIDGDDFLALDACELLYETATKSEVDILCFSGVNYEPGVGISDNYFARDRGLCNRVMPGREFLARARSRNVFYCAVWLNLYKSAFLKEFAKHFQFRLNCAHQDTDHTPILYTEAKSVMCIHYAPYYRLLRDSSITGVGETLNKMNDKLAVSESLVGYIRERRLPFGHPLCEFAFKDLNYFLKVYREHFSKSETKDVQDRFLTLMRDFEFIKHKYGKPFS